MFFTRSLNTFWKVLLTPSQNHLKTCLLCTAQIFYSSLLILPGYRSTTSRWNLGNTLKRNLHGELYWKIWLLSGILRLESCELVVFYFYFLFYFYFRIDADKCACLFCVGVLCRSCALKKKSNNRLCGTVHFIYNELREIWTVSTLHIIIKKLPPDL